MKRIAVIGSGIAGLVSACLLSKQYEVSLFEANDYLGGHTHTVDVNLGGKTYAVDTGFIVFNKRTYPNFCRLLNEYNISISPTEMSFSYHSDKHTIEYNGHNLNTLFADRANLVNPTFYRFMIDILRFNHDAKRFLARSPAPITLKEFVRSKKYSDLF